MDKTLILIRLLLLFLFELFGKGIFILKIISSTSENEEHKKKLQMFSKVFILLDLICKFFIKDFSYYLNF